MKIVWDIERREINYSQSPHLSSYARHVGDDEAKAIDDFWREHAPAAYDGSLTPARVSQKG